MNPELKSLVDRWLQVDRNLETRAEVNRLLEKKEFSQLSLIMKHRMEFGTAGLRAAMGAGFARMNDVTVIGAAQGLSLRLSQQCDISVLRRRGVVIGYDARHNSQRFAQLSANVFLNARIKVYLFQQHCPTPFVPFAVQFYKCLAGVMVTASHNPKQDNGYKVYWSNGAQIIPPVDLEISECIAKEYEPKDSSWRNVMGAIDAFSEISRSYFAALLRDASLPSEARMSSPIRVCYTAMHGVGYEFFLHALETFRFPKSNFFMVEEQVKPDPEFPTVAFPNPEEGASALDLAMRRANDTGCQLILANDPDADRLAVAERTPAGAWRLFTGNEIGAILGWWIFDCYARKYGRSREALSKCWMLSSSVSSKILSTMAVREGFNFEETLTGFKWMGSRAAELEKQGGRVVFAFEEAIGFMCGTKVLDKDGISAAATLLECATWLATQKGLTLSGQLDAIYAQYGKHVCSNSYVISPSPMKTTQMFGSLRSPEYPKQIGGLAVIGVRDLTTCFDSRTENNKPLLPCSKSSNMVTFYMERGITVTLRGSGTEPKIKWYSEIISDDPKAAHLLKRFVDTVVKNLIRPSYYGFKVREGSSAQSKL